MRDTILILVAILMVAFGALSIVSSNDDYAAERLFYRANKNIEKITENPDVALPAMVASVESNLEKILEKYPQSTDAKAAHLTLAYFYLNNEKYEQALVVLYKTINRYSDDRLVLSRVHFLKGNVYEKQNQWDKALREYTILRDEYIDMPIGLGIPLYIGSYYKEKQRYAKADQAYNEAVVFYKKIERKEKGKAPGYAAANLLTRAYIELKQYEQAGSVVEDTINDYPKLLPLIQQLENVDLIFIEKLNRPEKAIEIYRNIKTKTKNPDFIKLLNKKIEMLEAQR